MNWISLYLLDSCLSSEKRARDIYLSFRKERFYPELHNRWFLPTLSSFPIEKESKERFAPYPPVPSIEWFSPEGYFSSSLFFYFKWKLLYSSLIAISLRTIILISFKKKDAFHTGIRRYWIPAKAVSLVDKKSFFLLMGQSIYQYSRFPLLIRTPYAM